MKGNTKLTGRIVLPGSPNYDQARMDYNSRFIKYPLGIVFCQCIEDVMNAVKWSRENDIPLRARSGRHSFEAFSLVDKGIIIDGSEMTKVRVDKQKGIAKVQTGIALGDLYTELFRYGVTIPAGTAPDVGIAGLTLGGGIGFLHRIWGRSLGGAVSDVAPSETAYYYRDANYILEFASRWKKDQDELENLCWVNQFRKAMQPYMKGNYVNFPDLAIKDWECTYYGTNIDRLIKIKRNYDPCNVFNFPLSIPLC